jgi:hypothetical protein
MQIIPRYLRQFSLRGLFVAMTLAAMFLGLHVRRVLDYKAAVLQLRERGVSLGCTHAHGLGPDFLYSWELTRIPLSHLCEWYCNNLCIEVHDYALLDDTTVTEADMALIAKVPLAFGFNIRNSRLEEGAIATMTKSCPFEQVAFVDTPLTIDEFDQLATMTCLTKIWLLGTSRSEDGVAILRQKLPSCEIALK